IQAKSVFFVYASSSKPGLEWKAFWEEVRQTWPSNFQHFIYVDSSQVADLEKAYRKAVGDLSEIEPLRASVDKDGIGIIEDAAYPEEIIRFMQDLSSGPFEHYSYSTALDGFEIPAAGPL